MGRLVCKRIMTITLCAVCLCTGTAAFLQIRVERAEAEPYWHPDYPRVDLQPILGKESLSEEDYRVLYEQTGLTRVGVDGLREYPGSTYRILSVQNAYFADYEVQVSQFAPFSYSHTMNVHVPMARLEPGDILISSSTYIAGWQVGHSALVINGVSRRILEALGPGDVSRLSSADTFNNTRAFMILRPKADSELRAQVAEYAKEFLVDVPYDFTVGVLSPKFSREAIRSTQCAHLIWYAYMQFGLDLDSDGGAIVTPRDLANSELVEVVQIYGMDPETLWA